MVMLCLVAVRRLYIYLTTLLTSPIVFFLYLKNDQSNYFGIFTIDSGFNDTSTKVNLVKSDSQVFSVLVWN